MLDARVPQAVLNAAIVRAMLDEQYRAEFSVDWNGEPDSDYQYCDMTPVVRVAVLGPTDPQYCPDDLWYVEVQYSTRGGRAGYGVNRNHVPRCYVN
jgi:hypothetical protein